MTLEQEAAETSHAKQMQRVLPGHDTGCMGTLGQTLTFSLEALARLPLLPPNQQL